MWPSPLQRKKFCESATAWCLPLVSMVAKKRRQKDEVCVCVCSAATAGLRLYLQEDDDVANSSGLAVSGFPEVGRDSLDVSRPSDTPKKKKGGGFESFGLSYPIFGGIKRKGYKVPTPIQRKTIPVIMSGVDVVAMARTGSGKVRHSLLSSHHDSESVLWSQAWVGRLRHSSSRCSSASKSIAAQSASAP